MITHVDRNLYRGPRPKSFAELEQFKIVHVINLQTGAWEMFSKTLYEYEFAEDFGMDEVDIQCSNFFPPSRAAVDKILGVIAEGRNVLVHCLHGQDRTGYVCAAYRIKVCGWRWQAAVAEMFAFGFHKIPYLWWVWSLH